MDERATMAVHSAVDTLARAVTADEVREQQISAGVVDLLAAITGQPTSAIPTDGPLVVESLQAAHLQAVLDAALGVNLPLTELAGGVRVGAITELLLADSSVPSADEPVAVAGSDISWDARFQPFELTDVQQAYVLGREQAHELGNVDAAFYVELATRDLDLDRFERALNATVARHDMLRAIVEDGLLRVLDQVPDYPIARADLTGLPPAEQQARLTELRAELTTRRRDLGSWPLFDVRATALDAHRGLLHLGVDLLVCDGASFARLMEELAARYAEPDRQWPELELTFRDYLRLVDTPEAAAAQDRSRRYWLDRLDDLPPAPELPLAVPLASIDRPRFHRRHHWLPAGQWRGFKDRAAAHGITPSTALAAAYTDVLARWARSADFTINLTVNNRRPVHRQVRDVIGDFTTLTLLEIHHDAGRPFADRAAAVQAQLWRDLDHRDFSAVRVMRQLARRAGPAAAVAPVVFSTFVGAGFDDDFAPDWLDGMPYTLAQAPQLSLESLVLEFGGGLNLTWDTVDEAFPPGLLDDMFAAYRDLVSRLADSDEAWSSADTVPLPAAQQATRDAVNSTAGPVPGELLHLLGTALAERGPEPAVITADRVLSYAELDRLGCRLGHGLRAAGAEVNRLVAVVMDKGWEQIAAVLGVLHSGAAYLPIDGSLPPDRIRRLLELGGVRLVLSQKAVIDRLCWPDGVTVHAVDDLGLFADHDETPPAPVQGADDLAYVIFTSGSTGEPKGVMIDHRGAANTCRDINDRFGIGPTDRVLGLSSLSFDLSVWDIFGVLAAGGALVLPEPTASRDPERWAQLVTGHRVTVWNTVPALMQMYLTYCEARPDLAGLDPLRLVMMSGDWIELGLADRIQARHPGPIEVISLGGATEASIWSVFHPIGEPEPGWKSVPYGTPLRNQTLHVLDGHGRPRPDWATGRLFIGGIGVARGYWGDPARTAERFVTGQRGRLYDTGDLARYRPGGTLEFLGRDDGQVKVNGYRIELGEIEHALASHPEVNRAVALADGNRLLAFVTPRLADAPEPSSGEAQVAEWRQVFDSLRTESAADTAGWTDTFTGRPIAEEDMREWAAVTARRVLALRPRRVLEIGCGAGLIASELIDECVEYVGTDLSERTLHHLRERIDRRSPATRVTLFAREARDLTGIPTGHFDCVVINSVLQYFPSVEYLLDTVRGALATLRPGGVVYLGDVRDLSLLAPFRTAVERARSGPDLTVRELAWQVAQRALTENELAVDPQLFCGSFGLPAAVLPRPGGAHTEMADYRYDVLLFQQPSEPITFAATVDWQDRAATLDALDRLLAQGVGTIRLRDVPNGRLVADSWWARLLTDQDAAGQPVTEYAGRDGQAAGCSPAELVERAARAGYACELLRRPDAGSTVFDAAFTRSEHDLAAAVRTYAVELAAPPEPATLANDPLAGRRVLALPEQVRQHVAATLPAYMVPAETTVLAGLPLTGNGKVDLARLRSLTGRRAPAGDQRQTAPRDAAEQTLAEAWHRVLGVAAGSVHENFFLSGGDSLLAVRLVRAAAEAGLTVSVDEVFGHPTIAELAELGRGRQAAADPATEPAFDPPVLAGDPARRGEPFPLTDLQQAYLLGRNGFFDLGNVAASFYVELAMPELDLARLAQAVNGLIARHDMLRAVIGPDGQWRVRAAVPRYEPAVADLRGLDPVRVEAELARVRAEVSSRIFDPAEAPLFEVRASLLDGGWRLHVSLDLLIADGGTVAAFFTELAARYAEPDRQWPELAVSFRDYHLAMLELEDTARYRRAADYWTERAAQLPAAPQLPLAADPAEVGQPHFARHSHRLPPPVWTSLKQAAGRHGVTPSSTLLAAYAEVLAAWSGRSAFSLNVTVNNRLPVHPQVPELLGDFTTVSLLGLDPVPGASFADRARAAQEQLARDLEHADFSGIRVMRELARLHGPAGAGMPVVFTSALGSGDATAGADFGRALAGLGELVGGIVHTPQVHLDHQVFEYDGELVLNWDYVVELFTEADVTAMFAEYVDLVQRLAADQDWDSPLRDAPSPAPGRPPVLASAPAPAAADARTEQLIARIWAQVFGLDRVERDADFAELGGDSLLALQVIAKAAAAGLTISPRDFFANQTPAALARVARPAEGAPAAAASAGGVALMPRQSALLREWQHPQRHNYVLLFDLAERLDRTALRVALRAVLRHHDGLRLSFRPAGAGWQAAAAGAADVTVPLTWLDLADDTGRDVVEATCQRLHDAIRLDQPPLLHVAYFQWPHRQQLLIVVNQLVIDNYACRVLCADLLTAYDQVVATGEALLAPATSALTWAGHAHTWAADPAVLAERGYWQRTVGDEEPPAAAAMTCTGAGHTAMIAIDPDATAAVLAGGLASDVLLAAVARAIGRRTGQPTVRIEVAAHGRDPVDGALNPARTVGRLSTQWPLRVPAEAGRPLREAVTAVAAARHRVPAAGRHYELLSELVDPALQVPPAPARVNYLGHADALWAPLGLSLSADHPGLPPNGEPEPTRLDVLAGVVGGRLLIACTPGDEELLRELGDEITNEFLGESRSLDVPSEVAALRHWLGHE